MPKAARPLAALALAVVLVLVLVPPDCSPSQELGFSPIPVVVSLDLDLQSTEAHEEEFEFGPTGRHELRYWIDLRGGPGSSPGSLWFEGMITIYDADRRPVLHEPFREELGPSQVGGVLLSFDSGAVEGGDPHSLSIVLKKPSQDLLEHYTNLRVYMKRLPAFPLLR